MVLIHFRDKPANLLIFAWLLTYYSIIVLFQITIAVTLPDETEFELRVPSRIPATRPSRFRSQET